MIMMLKKKVREMLPEIILLAAVFLFLLCWAIVQPLNASPDEHMRYQIIEYIMKYGKLPHGGEEEIRNELWGISYAFKPILPYMIGAVFGKVSSFLSASEMSVVIGARSVNVLFGTATAALFLKIGRTLFDKEAARLFAILGIFLPQALFIHSYLNTDSIAVFSSAWIVWCWIKALKYGWSKKLCIELGSALSVCALSYYNAYGFILCSILFFAVSILLCEDRRWNVRKLFTLGFIVTVVVILLAGWWFIRSGILYNGDILGMNTSSQYAEMYARDDLKPSNRQTPQRLGMDVLGMLLWKPGGWPYNWIITVAVSFVGTFGFMDIFMPKLWSEAYFILFGIGIIGMFLNLRTQFTLFEERREEKRTKNENGIVRNITIYRMNKWSMENVFRICMLIAMIIPFILLVSYSYSSDFQAQGRYLMPMLVPFMYFITLGIKNLLERFVKREKLRTWIYRLVSLCYIASAFGVYFIVFLPNYR